MDKQSIPETMLEAARQFADPQVAHDFLVQIRWSNGVACPRTRCGSTAVAYMPKHRRWYCNECKRQFTAKLGTLFKDSPRPTSAGSGRTNRFPFVRRRTQSV